MKIFGKATVKYCLTMAVAVLVLSAGCEDSKKKISAEKSQADVAPKAALPASAYVPLTGVPPEIVFKSFPQTRLPENDSIKKTVGQYLAAGMKFQLQGRLDDAQRQYESARMYAPDSPRVLKALGMIWMAKREYEKSANYFRMSLDIDPDDLQVQINLGRVYLMQNKPEDALYCFRAALMTKQAKPENVETAYAVLYRSRLLEKLGYFTAAMQSYDYLESLVKKNWASYQNDSVIGDFVLKPERFMIARGNLYDQLLEPQKALEEYKKALARDRNAVKVGVKVFEIYVQLGDYKNAELLLENFAQQEDYENYLGHLAVSLCVKSRDAETPLRLWKQFRKHNPISTIFAFALADAADVIHAWPQEKAILNDVLLAMPDAPQAAQLLAQLSIKTGHPEESMERMAELILSNNKAFDSVMAAMDIIAVQPESRTLLDAFIAQTTASAPAMQAARNYVAAVLAMKLNQSSRGEKLLEQAIKTAPKFAPAYVSLMNAKWVKENPAQADAFIKQMKDNVTGVDYYYALGSVQLARSQYLQAIESLCKARELDEANELVIMKLSQAYELESRKTTDTAAATKYSQEHEELLQTAIELRPDKIDAYQQLFEKYINRLDLRKAADIAVQVIKNIPDSPQGRIMAAETYLVANNRKRARVILTDAVKRWPDDPSVKLLQIRYDLGERAGLITKKTFDINYAALKRLIANAPDFAPAYEMAGRLLSMTMPADYAEAVKYFALACRLAPDDFSCAREYLMVLMRAGDYKTALPLAETLHAESPRSMTLKQAIVSCLVATGDEKKAIEYIAAWRKAMPSNKAYVDWMLKIYFDKKDYAGGIKLLDQLSKTSEFSASWIAEKKFGLFMASKNFKEATAIVKQGQLENVMQGVVLLVDAMAADKQYDSALAYIADLQKAAKGDESKIKQLKGMRFYILSKADRMKQFMAELAKEKRDPGLCTNAYAALMAGSHYKEALTLLNKWQITESFNPDDSQKDEINNWCREMIVATYLAMYDYDDANQALQNCIATDGEKSWFYYYSANILMHKGENEDAVFMLQKAIQQDPKNPILKNDLAYQLAVTGRDLKTAEKLARECLQEKGFEPAFMDTLAWVFYKDKQPGLAGEIFLKIVPMPEKVSATLAAAKKSGQRITAEELNPVILSHLGDVLESLGWTQVAREYWQLSIEVAKQWPVQTHDIEQVVKSSTEKLNKK